MKQFFRGERGEERKYAREPAADCVCFCNAVEERRPELGVLVKEKTDAGAEAVACA